MPSPAEIRNVILCEDIRSEIGNKQSLMGVFSGDIVVGEVPATVQMGVFFQYFPAIDNEGLITVEIELYQDEALMVAAKMEAALVKRQPATFVLPKALATFEKECMFKISAAVNGGPKQEILRKKIMKGDVVPRPF